jgi:hypothetical protein
MVRVPSHVHAHPILNTNKPEQKKASLAKPAKDAKKILKSWFLKPKDYGLLCELGVSLRSAYGWLREKTLLF